MEDKIQLQCLICEKKLERIKGMDCPNGCGEIQVTFGYGSRFDQLNNPLRADLIITHICDDCFKKKYHLFKRFIVKTETKRILIAE